MTVIIHNLAGNTEMANASGLGWEVRPVPEDDREHTIGNWCPVCTTGPQPGPVAS